MKFSKILKLSNLTLLAVTSGVFPIQPSVLAAESTVVANLNYEQVGQETAIASGINVTVNPGRIAVIDFSATDEAISYIGLGDASFVVYNTDLTIQSGMAQTIFLLPIEELKFPGATTTKITNLVVKTVDAGGVSRVYNFQINHSQSVTNLGIKITSQTLQASADVNRSGIKVSYGRTANLDDVARGLTLAISRGLTTADDPVVSKVRRFIALARNGELTVLESAISAEIDLAVISSLAEMALDQFSLAKADNNVNKLTDSRDEPAKVNLDSSKEQSTDQPRRGKAEGRGQKAEGKNCPEYWSQVPSFRRGDIQLTEASEPNSAKLKTIDFESFAFRPGENLLPAECGATCRLESNSRRIGTSASCPLPSQIESNGEVKTSPREKTTPVNRIDSVLNAHALYFGWQKVVRQGRLEIDPLTQAKVERAINLVSRGSSLEAALIEADIDAEVGSLLLAISRGDTEALSSLFENVSKVGE